MGSSTSPVLLTLPTSENILVPLLWSVPFPANQADPFKMIRGTLAHVSTLLRQLGRSHKPRSVAWTCLARGSLGLRM